MHTQQAPSASRTPRIFAGLVLLGLAVAWVATSFDEAAGPDLGEAGSGPTVEPAPTETTASGTSSSRQRSEPETDTARQAAARSPETQVAIQAAIRAANADDRDTAISPNVGRTLSKVIELLNANKIDEATAALDPMLTADAMSQMTPFERSRLYQISFNLNMKRESYEAAQADIQAAIESGGLNAKELSQMTYQNAQLYVQQEDYAKATDSLELWVAQQDAAQVAGADRNLGAYYLLAASYYYQDKFDDARDHMETLFAMPGEKQEGWYSMMAALYLQNEDYAKARPVVEKMVELYGNDRYREQLAGINAQLQKAER
jgi:tetratricopeptide (TPR) repeat protein